MKTEEIIKYDASYNEAMFLSKVDHIFIMILDAIMDNDMSGVKHYLSDEIYQRYENLVNTYKSKKLTRLFDQMNVKSTRIDGYNINDNKLNINVTISARHMDYFIDENGNYVSGIDSYRIEKDYKIVFTKSLNAKELQEARRCPNCGKTLDINATGVCPYCKNTIDMSNYDYIITKIE